MAVISNVSICNSALIKLGAGRIVSFGDDSKEAKLCNEQYEKIRDDLLLSHPWNFAITRKGLALSTYVPAYDFEQAFTIPLDVLRILATDLNVPESTAENPWSVETDPVDPSIRYLVTNNTVVNIRYIKKVAEASFTPAFAECLSLALARDMAYALTQSTTMLQAMDKGFRDKVREIRSYDAQENSLQQVSADDWLTNRLG